MESSNESRSSSVPSMESLLKRGNILLEDGEFNSATELFNRILDIDPENSKAYLGLLMAETKVTEPSALTTIGKSLTEYSNYKRALRFADGEQRKVLEKLGEQSPTYSINGAISTSQFNTLVSAACGEQDDTPKRVGWFRYMNSLAVYSFLVSIASVAFSFFAEIDIYVFIICSIAILGGITSLLFETPKTNRCGMGIAAIVTGVISWGLAIASALLFNSSAEHIQSVKSARHLTTYQSTYGSVLDKYITSAKWETRVESKDLVFVEVSGQLVTPFGESTRIVVTFRLTPRAGGSSEYKIDTHSLEFDNTVYGSNAAFEIMSSFFDADNSGYRNWFDYMEIHGYLYNVF
jgi:hypothetical protein